MKTIETADYMSPQMRRAWRFYHPEWESEAPEELRLVGGGCEWCQGNYRIERASFPYWAFEFVVGGEGELVLPGKRHQLRPGAAFSYGPGIAQCMVSSAENPLVKYFINFVHADGAEWLQTCHLEPGILLWVGRPAKVAAALDDCISESLSATPGATRLAELYLEIAVRTTAADALPVKIHSQTSHASFLRCRDLLTRHYLELKSLDEAAKACGMSVPHLCRLFQKHGAGTTPHQLLTRLRLSHGAHLLSQGKLVKEAAAACGYPDPGHFSRLFQQHFGRTPGVFR